jgi:hypothetical protein
MEPPAVPNTVKLEKCAGVVSPSTPLAIKHHKVWPVVTFLTMTSGPAVT